MLYSKEALVEAKRRVEAFEIAVELIEREMDEVEAEKSLKK